MARPLPKGFRAIRRPISDWNIRVSPVFRQVKAVCAAGTAVAPPPKFWPVPFRSKRHGYHPPIRPVAGGSRIPGVRHSFPPAKPPARDVSCAARLRDELLLPPDVTPFSPVNRSAFFSPAVCDPSPSGRRCAAAGASSPSPIRDPPIPQWLRSGFASLGIHSPFIVFLSLLFLLFYSLL
jgi:hypothetical protein